MSSPDTILTYIPGQHFVKPIPFKAHKVKGFSAENLEQHFETHYGRAIVRLNQIEVSLAADNQSNTEALRSEQLLLANSIILHETYFDSIGEDGGAQLANAELIHALNDSFGSVAQWQADFRFLAESADSGWVVLAWSERFKRLANIYSTDGSQTLLGSTPILVLCMAEYAYSQDFGSNPMAYFDAFVSSINWPRAVHRFQQAIGTTHLKDESSGENSISVADLKARIDQGKDVMVLDVRHSDDRDRYKWRIMETDFYDSFNVDSWANELPKNIPVVVYCMYGFWVSQKAAEELRKHGVDAHSLSGGVTSWRAMGYPSSENNYLTE